jgi:hypothetical protein
VRSAARAAEDLPISADRRPVRASPPPAQGLAGSAWGRWRSSRGVDGPGVRTRSPGQHPRLRIGPLFTHRPTASSPTAALLASAGRARAFLTEGGARVWGQRVEQRLRAALAPDHRRSPPAAFVRVHRVASGFSVPPPFSTQQKAGRALFARPASRLLQPPQERAEPPRATLRWSRRAGRRLGQACHVAPPGCYTDAKGSPAVSEPPVYTEVTQLSLPHMQHC